MQNYFFRYSSMLFLIPCSTISPAHIFTYALWETNSNDCWMETKKNKFRERFFSLPPSPPLLYGGVLLSWAWRPHLEFCLRCIVSPGGGVAKCKESIYDTYFPKRSQSALFDFYGPSGRVKGIISRSTLHLNDSFIQRDLQMLYH